MWIELGDFGFATFIGKNTKYMTCVGTVKYMGYEVMTAQPDKAKFSAKADIYSLGVIAQELFDIDINSSVFSEFYANSDKMITFSEV